MTQGRFTSSLAWLLDYSMSGTDLNPDNYPGFQPWVELPQVEEFEEVQAPILFLLMLMVMMLMRQMLSELVECQESTLLRIKNLVKHWKGNFRKSFRVKVRQIGKWYESRVYREESRTLTGKCALVHNCITNFNALCFEKLNEGRR